jgi:hypothetical protein
MDFDNLFVPGARPEPSRETTAFSQMSLRQVCAELERVNPITSSGGMHFPNQDSYAGRLMAEANKRMAAEPMRAHDMSEMGHRPPPPETWAYIARLERENERLKAQVKRLLPVRCACRFDDDGETILSWCNAHAIHRDRIAEQDETIRRLADELAIHKATLAGLGLVMYPNEAREDAPHPLCTEASPVACATARAFYSNDPGAAWRHEE